MPPIALSPSGPLSLATSGDLPPRPRPLALPLSGPGGAFAPPPSLPPPRRRPVALVVEDSGPVRLMLCMLLKRLEMDVVQACNGREAVAACAAGEFSVIIMDKEMPIMDGHEATEVGRCRLTPVMTPD